MSYNIILVRIIFSNKQSLTKNKKNEKFRKFRKFKTSGFS